MKPNIFAKKGKSGDGREFPIFLSTLHKKDGTEVKVSVKFRQDSMLDAKKCPCVIEVDKKNANLDVRDIKDKETGEYILDLETGEVKKSRTLWITEWAFVGPYVDHSLDDYE